MHHRSTTHELPTIDDDNKDDEIMVDDPAHAATGGTVTAAVFGIIKAMVGPAILYLPRSFANAGYGFALVALAATLAMYLYASDKLLASWRHVVMMQQQQQQEQFAAEDDEDDEEEINNNKNNINNKLSSKDDAEDKDNNDDEIEMISLTVPTTHKDGKDTFVTNNNEHDDEQNDYQLHASVDGKDGLLRVTVVGVSYPQLAHMAYGAPGETAVRAGICAMQLGICLTYFIFVPHNVSASVAALTHGAVDLPLSAGLASMVVLEIPLCWIRDIRKLVHTNVAANVLILFGLLSSLYLALVVAPSRQEADGGGDNASPSLTHLSPWNDQWYLFIGTAVSSLYLYRCMGYVRLSNAILWTVFFLTPI